MYSWRDHTAELELVIEAPTLEAVFSDALTALSELLGEDPAGAPGRRQVRASAPDRAALLAEWLAELVYGAEADSFVPERVESLTLTGGEIVATVAGRWGNPPPLVKGVTYHRLALDENGNGWRARVVFDV